MKRGEGMGNLLKFEYKSKLGHIVFNNPPYNFLTIELLSELNENMDFLISQEDCKALVISAVGRYFSAGFDYSKHTKVNTFSIFESFKSFIEKLLNFERPIIFAVSGKVLSSGIDLLLFGDIVIATEDSTFSFLDMECGRIPLISSFLLGDFIGRINSYDLIVSGGTLTAEKMRELGLITRVVEKGKLSISIKEYLSIIFTYGNGVLSTFSSVSRMDLREKYEKRIEDVEYLYLNVLSEYPEYENGGSKFLEGLEGKK